VSVHERAVGKVLSAAGLSLPQLRSTREPVIREVDLTAILRVHDMPGGSTSAPNVAAILEGSDPQLRHEYVVFSAHMDHVGVGRAVSGADSIHNGADDNASGTAGVLELAEAFAQGPRPRRSLIFLAVSGEERGLWGSEHFAANPPVPIRQVVANLNMDMIGRNWRDTIVVIGREHSDLGSTLARVNAAHPELGMTAIGDLWPEENFYFRSDHYNFAKRGVPVLFFFNGVHADYHQPSDSPDRIDAEKQARLLRLIYHLGVEIADAPERPRWVDESYRTIVKPELLKARDPRRPPPPR
jgi:Zn-dependent M28 family amino/carboxypeptidase